MTAVKKRATFQQDLFPTSPRCYYSISPIYLYMILLRKIHILQQRAQHVWQTATYVIKLDTKPFTFRGSYILPKRPLFLFIAYFMSMSSCCCSKFDILRNVARGIIFHHPTISQVWKQPAVQELCAPTKLKKSLSYLFSRGPDDDICVSYHSYNHEICHDSKVQITRYFLPPKSAF